MVTSPEPALRAPQWPRTFQAMRHRNFRLFLFGQGVSLIGTWMQIVAQGWLVYRLTDSPLMLGLVSVVGLLPVVPVSLLAGPISDRFPRRNLILATELVLLAQAATLALLTWLNVIQLWHIIALSFVLGMASALEQPARLAFVVDTVGKEDLTNAVALSSSVYNVARILGPSAAGLIVAWIGEAGCFAANAVSYLAVILALLAMRLPGRVKSTARLQMASSMIAGFRYLWNTKTLRALMSIVAISSFFTMSFVALMPVFAGDVLHVGPQGLGWLMAGVGIGAISGTLTVANIQPGRRGKWLTWGSILGPVFLVVFSLSRSFAASLVFVALAGASSAVRNTLANGLIQIECSEEYHGRVMSVFNLLFSGMSQLGALAAGAVAEVTGAPWAIGLSAAVGMAWALIVLWRMLYVYRLS